MSVPSDENKYAYSERFVAFLNILGFADLPLRQQPDVEHTIRIFETVMDTELLWSDKDWSTRPGYSERIFSDCVCLTAPVSEAGFSSLLFRIAVTQGQLARYGIYLRGGVDIGRHYESTSLLFSEGLVRAHNIERTLAVNPRVVFSEAAKKVIASQIPKKETPNILLLWLLFDVDRQMFVDYLGVLAMEGKDIHERTDYLKDHKNALLDNMSKHRDQPRVFSKLSWLGQYHDHTVRQLGGPKTNDLWRAVWFWTVKSPNSVAPADIAASGRDSSVSNRGPVPDPPRPDSRNLEPFLRVGKGWWPSLAESAC